jgi:hypothetical protein
VDSTNPPDRVSYPVGAENTCPVLRMGLQVTTGVPGAILGFFRVNARYTVRGRRGVPLPVEQRLTEAEKIRLYAMLRQEFEPIYQKKGDFTGLIKRP